MTGTAFFPSVTPQRAGIVCLLAATLVLSACGNRKEDQVAFNGIYFSSKADRVSKEERDHFRVQVKKATQDLGAAREAGRYAATRYCIEQYGTSSIEWVIGPDSESIVPVDGVIQLEGYCQP